MVIEKLNPPKGTKDWFGKEAVTREHIVQTVQETCRLYGYSPIHVPEIERREILEAGYQGSKRPSFFTIMQRGRSLDDSYRRIQGSGGNKSSVSLEELSDLGLRYDLTIPTARALERYHLEEFFPIKRYQIGKAWRTDRPGRGIYREYTACDIDAFGSSSHTDDVELILLMNDIFEKLEIPLQILVNNSKIVSVTKTAEGIEEVGRLKDLARLEEIAGDDIIAQEGIAELNQIFNILGKSHIKPETVQFFPGLRRSPAYVGTIITARVPGESKIPNPMGGGRYFEASSTFSEKTISAVGLTMSVERMQIALGMDNTQESIPNIIPDILVVTEDKRLVEQAFKVAAFFRSRGINTMLYSNLEDSLGNQMRFADKNQIGYVAIVKGDTVALRDFATGEQKEVDPSKETKFDLESTFKK